MFSAQTLAYTMNASVNLSKSELEAVTSYDETEIYSAFEEVNNLVVALENNNDLTYSDLEATNSELVSNVNSSAAIAMSSTSDGTTPPFISAFLWGCIFNLAGMLIVGVTTGFDNDQLKKSAWGCLISSLLWGSSGYWGLGY